MGQRICGWNFKHWESDSGKMNLINLPMLDSAVFKKLVDKSAILSNTETGDDSATDRSSKKGQKRNALPQEVTSELEAMGISKKVKVDVPQSEPGAGAPEDGCREQQPSDSLMEADEQPEHGILLEFKYVSNESNKCHKCSTLRENKKTLGLQSCKLCIVTSAAKPGWFCFVIGLCFWIMCLGVSIKDNRKCEHFYYGCSALEKSHIQDLMLDGQIA